MVSCCWLVSIQLHGGIVSFLVGREALCFHDEELAIIVHFFVLYIVKTWETKNQTCKTVTSRYRWLFLVNNLKSIVSFLT